ncbi:hypothetical protein [Shewanella sp. Isolate11]|uniref:hypothetical protein n=1 Tax=Shewanella sp. Isolate11 TaxID=2908530 RepID=UPI001EFE077E|nr:hypothetical protein [Shewanella sp. Isolate11]MCG9696365.1 hypothetical protein [Shewanella sp. Isolate11]
MWSWLSQLYAQKSQPKRKRVQVDIPIEQSRYSGFSAGSPKDSRHHGKDKGVN